MEERASSDALRILPLNAWELALLEELQQARSNPSAYARLLEAERKPKYQGLDLVYRGERRRDDFIIETYEGVKACEEAILFLGSAKPRPRLSISVGLCLAAKKAVNGAQGSTDVNSTGFIAEYGRLEPSGTAAEVAAFGASKTARDMFFNLLICDGDSFRSERNDIFAEQWNSCGVACGKHATKTKMAIFNFATRFTDKEAILKSPLDNKFKQMWQGVNEL